MTKNIVLTYTLDKYNKKYKNLRNKLLKYSKKEVEEFDRTYGHYRYNNQTRSLEFFNYILRHRKWALIGDTYYEIPRPIRLVWFRNLHIGVQVTICALALGGIAASVAIPLLLNRQSSIFLELKLDDNKDFYCLYDVEFKKGSSYTTKINVPKMNEYSSKCFTFQIYEMSAPIIPISGSVAPTIDFSTKVKFERKADDTSKDKLTAHQYSYNKGADVYYVGKDSFKEDDAFLTITFKSAIDISNCAIKFMTAE